VVVSLEVEGEVVGAGECAAARPTAERLVAGVLAVVTTQLVGAREPPLTAVPLAPERTLAYTTHTHTPVASTRVQGWGDEPCEPTVHLPD